MTLKAFRKERLFVVHNFRFAFYTVLNLGQERFCLLRANKT